MQLYILRHGIAADLRPGGKDADRVLTAEGRQKLQEVLRRARAAGVAPGVMISSPLVRAVESARLAAGILGYEGEIFQTRVLMPDSAPEDVWNEIQLHRSVPGVLLAGHEPLLSQFLSWLLNSPYVCVDLKPGALARVDTELTSARPRGVLQWLITSQLAAGAES
jgi:phosphohistidine phosphatase